MTQPLYYSRLARTQVTRGGNLPHWNQPCATFVTFRLADSLPEGRLAQLQSERDEWLLLHPEPWDDQIAAEYHALFPRRFHEWLDAGHGSCILRDSAIRQIVEDSLRHFADQRYSLYAFVVMPNHVHVLFMPESGFDGRAIVQSWKSYTAKEINKRQGREGVVWQKESYDRLVRSAEEFAAYRAYIRRNDSALAFDAYVER